MHKKFLYLATILGAIALLGVGCANKTQQTAALEENTPAVAISNQNIGTDNQITIDAAAMPDDGWAVIHTMVNGQPGDEIGYASLPKGNTRIIKTTIDRTKLTPTLLAMLHYDRGQKGVFEFPGADGPVIRNQQIIMEEFKVLNYADTTANSSTAQNAAPHKEFVITAKQWSFSPSVIRVKKGDVVVLKLKSVDVMHGMSIPDFGINAQIKPGELNTVEFVADKAGTFKFICNVPCGVGHMGMTGTIIVE